jgi:hypothetical protein
MRLIILLGILLCMTLDRAVADQPGQDGFKYQIMKKKISNDTLI